MKSLKVHSIYGPLSDIEACCGLQNIGYKESAGHQVIELTSDEEQHPCGGSGTASFSPSDTYTLNGNELELLKETTTGSH